jgi:hypothetical protein
MPRRILAAAALAGGAYLVLRRRGPALRRRCLDVCGRMFEQLPEDFPPKRMAQGIEELREQTGRILRLLEEGKPGPTGMPS